MKNTIQTIMAGLLIIAISTTISSCSSPKTPVEVKDKVAGMDTAKTIDTSKDTVVARTPLTLIITNLASPNAPVSVGVYGSKNKFLDNTDRLKEYKFTPNGKILTAQIVDLKYGEFAMAIYQDVNLDGKYNKTLMGLPKEPYGFSNNFKPKFKAPGFGDCQFAYNKSKDTLAIAMIR